MRRGATCGAYWIDLLAAGRHAHFRCQIPLKLLAHKGCLCAVQGMEPLTYSWLKDGQRLSSINPKQPILQLSAVQAEDAGLYSCIVSNADGVIVSREAALLVAEHQEG